MMIWKMIFLFQGSILRFHVIYFNEHVYVHSHPSPLSPNKWLPQGQGTPPALPLSSWTTFLALAATTSAKCQGGFFNVRFFVFTPTWGNDRIWLIFSDGLKPPTSVGVILRGSSQDLQALPEPMEVSPLKKTRVESWPYLEDHPMTWFSG